MKARRSKPHRRRPKAKVILPSRLPNWRALITPVLGHVFSELRVSATVSYRDWWHHIYSVRNIIDFEGEYGVHPRRWAYNERTLAEVRRTGKMVCGQHAGFRDLYVPLQDETGLQAILVTGPFALARPTSAEILERWYAITGTRARLSDPSFAQYLSMTLSTLTLEGAAFSAYERFIVCLAGLMTGQGATEALAAEAEALRPKLLEIRAAERMWDSARDMVSERNSVGWATDRARLLRSELNRMPEHVVVGLVRSEQEPNDPVDELLRREAFQRACTSLARKLGNVVCGQVGDHGVAFLVNHAGSGARARTKLVDVATRASALARRFGLSLRSGISQKSGQASLPACFRAALEAAEMGLTRDQSIVMAEPRGEPSFWDLKKLRMQLRESLREEPGLMAPRFDRYIEAVLQHSGYRSEPVRTELDAGLEWIAEPLLATGALDQKSFQDLCTRLERAAAEATTVKALVLLYRQCISDIERAIRYPTTARRHRGIDRAVLFMREHSSEPLTLAQVARAAGFAPDYFSRIFRRTQGVTFEHFLQQLRVAQSKQMLRETTLGLDGISKLSGFANRIYFHKVFKDSVGMTPIEYRHGH
ncbi:MAG TPA: AraC family transcriptional regulator [Polyangiaceae bacterium]|nr:AraC family transcriptional regulator [Polyangiaceae bacterium]